MEGHAHDRPWRRLVRRWGLAGSGGACLLLAALAGWISYDLLWKLPRVLGQASATAGGSGVVLHDTFVLTAGGVEISPDWIPYLGVGAGVAAGALAVAGVGWLRATAEARG